MWYKSLGPGNSTKKKGPTKKYEGEITRGTMEKMGIQQTTIAPN